MRTHWKNKASGSWQWLRDSKWRIVALLVCVGYILGSQPRQAAAIVRKYQDVLWNKNTAGKLFNYFAAGTGMKATVQSGTDKDKTPKNKIVPPGPNIPLVTLQGGDTQATATPICSFPANLSGTTVGATDDYDLPPDTTSPTLTANCATGTGAGPAGSLPRGAVYTGTGTAPDVVYKMEFPAGSTDTLTITMDPTGSQDLSLIVYCNTVSSSLSDGLVIDDTGVGGVAESVTVSNIVAGTTLYIVVDGYSTGGTPPGPSGAYTLSITSDGNTQPNCGPVCAPFTCPTNINVNTDPGACTAVVNYTPPTGQDCTITCTPASGTTFPLGTTTVTCSNTGGTPSCTFLVSVADNSPPTVACPANITVNGSSPTVVNYTVPTAADNCGASVACVPNTGSSFPVGTTTVTCTATDGSQNMSSCNFTVSVVACTITCPADQVAWTAGTSAVVSYPAPTADASCGTVTCSPASGSTFNVGTTTVTCSTTAGPSCSFNVTVNQLTLGAALADPIACTGPGNKVNGSFSATNNSGASATVSVSATLSNIAYLPNTASATQSGSIIVLANVISWTGTLGAGQTVTVNWMGQIADLAQPSSQACSVVTATVNGLPVAGQAQACLTVNCPAVGPGGILPATSEASDQKAGSVLIYNVYTSSTDPTKQNTRINITNVHLTRSAFVHLFFVSEGCAIADSYICLTGNQTASFLASDLDPGTTGYLVAVAVDGIRGCPISFNYLIGDEYVKFNSGHAANLGAIAFSQIAGGLPACDGNSVTAQLNFDGTSYNRTPATLALSNVGSRADGNDTLLILNRIGGNLGIGASSLGTLFGILYDDAENALSFNVTGGCQLRSSLSNNFPRTTPRFETFIPAGRTGWLKLFNQTGAIGLTGAAINNNANAASSAGAFNQGHNLHHLTLNSGMNYIIPVFPPSC